jgi:multidrug efflux system membrane fusion protein
MAAYKPLVYAAAKPTCARLRAVKPDPCARLSLEFCRMRGVFSLACFSACLAALLPAAAAAQSAPPPVTVGEAARRDVPEFISGVGTVQAYRSVLVRARVDGELEQIAFREGQEVKPGDLLAVIDPRPYAATLAQAEAKRAGDVATLENARLDLARYATLAKSNFASRQQLDTQQATTNLDLANIQQDDAAIQSAQLNLSYCRLESPISGVVGLRQVDIGNLVHATDTTGIVTITQIKPISLVFTLPQEALPKVQDAMAAAGPKGPPVVAYTSDGGRELSSGYLLTPSNSIDTTTGTIALKATFENTDKRLWPGQFVAAKLELGILRNAVTVPDAAIQHGPDGLYVFTVQPDHTAQRKDVKVGYEGEGNSVITDGLNGGEEIITAGQVRVQAGQKVDPHPEAKS